MSKSMMRDRVLAALPSAGRSEFPATELPYIVMAFERPDIDALYGKKKVPNTAWLDAVNAWQAEQRGISDTAMRNLAEQLTEEGVLIRRRDVRGWYVQNFYSVAQKGGQK